MDLVEAKLKKDCLIIVSQEARKSVPMYRTQQGINHHRVPNTYSFSRSLEPSTGQRLVYVS
jgi:hypothetical protein